MQKCSICGKYFEEWGNNAEPINNGTCCDKCNTLIVIPRRMQDFQNRKEAEQRMLNQLERRENG